MVNNNKNNRFNLKVNTSKRLFVYKGSMDIDRLINFETIDKEAINKEADKVEFEMGNYDDLLDAKKSIIVKLMLNSFLDKLNKNDKLISLHHMVRSENKERFDSPNFDNIKIEEIENKIVSNKKLSGEEKNQVKDYLNYCTIFNYGLKKMFKNTYFVMGNSINSLDIIKLNAKENVEYVKNSEFFSDNESITPTNKINLAFNIWNYDPIYEKYSYGVTINMFFNRISKGNMRLNKKLYKEGIKNKIKYFYRYYKKEEVTQIEFMGFKDLMNPTNDDIYNALKYAIKQQNNLIK